MLGGFRLRMADDIVALPMSSQRLICFLAIQAQPLLRTFIAGSLWGDSTDLRAAGSLRSALWRIPEPTESIISLSSDHLAIAPEVRIDLREGEALARTVLDDAIDLTLTADAPEEVLTADLLPDWTEEWVLLERERYHQLRLRALEALCVRLTAAGRPGQAVQAGVAAVQGEPLRESARTALIAAHLAEQNTAAALREFESYRQLLRDELDLEPSEELRRLIDGA